MTTLSKIPVLPTAMFSPSFGPDPSNKLENNTYETTRKLTLPILNDINEWPLIFKGKIMVLWLFLNTFFFFFLGRECLHELGRHREEILGRLHTQHRARCRARSHDPEIMT